jgi:hypothetical protein
MCVERISAFGQHPPIDDLNADTASVDAPATAGKGTRPSVMGGTVE